MKGKSDPKDRPMRRWNHATSAFIHVLIVSTICIYEAKQPQEAGIQAKKLSINTEYISIERNKKGYTSANNPSKEAISKKADTKYLTTNEKAAISLTDKKSVAEESNSEAPSKQVVERKEIKDSTEIQQDASSAGQGTIEKPVCKKCIKPKYPKRALRRGLEGATRVNLYVSKKGEVTSALVVKSSGVQSIDKAALEAAIKSKFFPQNKEGQITIEYILKMPEKS